MSGAISCRSIATVAGANAFSVAGIDSSPLFPPLFAHGNRLFGQGLDVLADQIDHGVKNCDFALTQGRLREHQPLFENKLKQGL